MVDVRAFGAVAQVVRTRGTAWVPILPRLLFLEDEFDWRPRAAVGILSPIQGIAPVIARVTSVLSRRLLLLDRPIAPFTRYVIVADDSLPCQEAIDSLGTSGGTVYFPPGEYTLGTPGAATNYPLVVASRVGLCGAGPGVTVLKVAENVRQFPLRLGANPNVFSAAAVVNRSHRWWFGDLETDPRDNGIVIRGMTLDGNKAGQPYIYPLDNRTNNGNLSASAGLHLDRTEESLVEDVEIRNFVTEGISLSGGNTVGNSRCIFKDLWIHDVGRAGFSNENGTLANNLILSNCTFDTNESWGINLEELKVEDITVFNCRFRGNGVGALLSPTRPDIEARNVSFVFCSFDGRKPST